MLQYQQVYHLIVDLLNNQQNLDAMLLSILMVAIVYYHLLNPYHQYIMVHPILIVLNHQVYENHSIVDQLKLFPHDPYVVMLIHAMYHHQHVYVMPVLLLHPNQDQHVYKYVHLIVRQQICQTIIHIIIEMY